MHKDDLIRLQHMHEAAQEAITFAVGKSRHDLDRDRVLTLAPIKSIEIIGEAASKISPETKAQCPGIPWHDISAMRNRLIHVYYAVNLDIVWSTITDDLPALLFELESILGP